MKINILSGCLFAATMTLTTACSDFLTEDPKGRLTPETLFKTKADVEMSLNSLYSTLLDFQCNSNTTIVQCAGSDVTSTTGANKAAYLSSDAFERPSDLKGVEHLWSKYYKIIKEANYVIDVIKTLKLEDEASESLGQGLFWRAYAYYGLVRNWGEVPVAPEAILSIDVNATDDAIPLTSVEGIYAKIVDDLKAAEACNLPEKYTEANKSKGDANIFITSQAVKSTLSAVYMSMAGYPLKKTECYALAADKAKEVIDAVNSRGVQTLLPEWKDVYNYGNNYSKECILGLYYNPNYGTWASDDSQFSSCHAFAKYYKDQAGWGDFLAERKFWVEYPEGPRKGAVYAKTIYTLNGNNVDWWATKDGKAYDPKADDENRNSVIYDYRPMFIGFSANKDDSGKPIAAAYDCTKPHYEGMCLDKTHQLIRYAEVLCWFAEASGRSGKHIAEAKEALKQIRQRAYSDPAAVTAVDAMTNDQLAEAAFNEHRYEVAGNVVSMVTCREDEFRMERLKSVYDYRVGAQNKVLVPKGTLTHSEDAKGNAFTYTTTEDLVLKEEMEVKAAWNGENSLYNIYPPVQVEKNPNLVRK